MKGAVFLNSSHERAASLQNCDTAASRASFNADQAKSACQALYIRLKPAIWGHGAIIGAAHVRGNRCPVGSLAQDWDTLFLDAALEPWRWDGALRHMAHATGAARGQLIGVGGPSEVPFNWANDVPEPTLRQFIEIRGGAPDINYRIGADLGSGAMQVVHEDDYDAAIPRLSSDIYLDYAHQNEIPFGCQTRLVEGPEGFIGLATLRTAQDGRSTAEQRGIFMDAAHAARRAVLLQMRLEGQQAQLMAGTLDAMRLAAFLFDMKGRLCGTTQGGERLIESGALRRTADMIEPPGDRHQVARAVAQVMRADGAGHARMRIARPRDGDMPSGDLFAELFRLPAREWSIRAVPRVIMMVRTSQISDAEAARHIAAAFGLSPAEGEVALALARGLSREAISAQRGVTRETLRGQFKAIYAKTGCRGETDLAMLVIRYLG